MLRRLLFVPPLLFVVSSLSFVLVSLTPGDAADEILGANAPEETYQRLREQLGLQYSVAEQYWRWLKHAVRGDLGNSLFGGQSVWGEIDSRLPVTLSLILVSLVVILVAGVALGVLSAAYGGVVGRIVDGVSILGYGVPAYWAGALLISFFAVDVRWFPATGYVPITQSFGEWARALALPVITLSMHGVAGIAKQTREAMLDALSSEHIRVARANGIPERSILFRHALRIASIRIVTVLGVYAVALPGGTVFVEFVFGLPGLGGLAVDASLRHDLPVMEGTLVIFTLVIVALNLLVDVAYTWLNPRISY